MEVSSDLERLSGLLDLPPGVEGARWVVEQLGPTGTSFLPGPTDLQLVALLTPWLALEATLGPPIGELGVILSPAAAEALLGADVGNEVRGAGYDAEPLSCPQFRATAAIRAGDSMLVAAISS
jgi:hypothetical protein